jgi:hypothetical protein
VKISIVVSGCLKKSHNYGSTDYNRTEYSSVLKTRFKKKNSDVSFINAMSPVGSVAID